MPRLRAIFAPLALALLVLAMSGAAPAAAAERMALVIGNGAYSSLGRLDNPVSDARLIAGALERTGFRVTLVTEANQAEMKRAIADFGRRLRSAPRDSVGLFYYAGHGVQAHGRNYLIPVGTDVRDEADLDIFGVQADWVLGQMESAGNAINIVVLDACRNNPFARSFRSVERGLARMSAPTGSFLAYATAPGDVAVDGTGRNSPYSAALARAIQTPGVPIEQVFKQVRIDVLEMTGGQQTPWESSSLTGDFYFNRGGGGSAPAVAARPQASAPEAPTGNNAPRQQAPATPAPEPEPEVAIATPQPPAVTGGRTVRLDVRLAFRTKAYGGCSQRGELSASINADAPTEPARVSVKYIPSTGSYAPSGHGMPDFLVSARPDGAGAVVTLRPVSGGSKPIEVRLKSLSPGTSATEYSGLRLSEHVACGNVIAYVDVAE